MKEENLLNKIDLETDGMYDFVDKEVKTAYLESFNRGLSGWRYDIYYDGDYNISGALSSGSNLMCLYNGEALYLGSVEIGKELDGDIVTLDNIDDLPDFKEFKEFVLEREYHPDDLVDKSQEEKTAMLYGINYFDSLYCEFNRNNYMKLVDEAVELDWGVYGRDKIIEDITNNVEALRYMDELTGE